MSSATISVPELAHRIRRSPDFVSPMLADWQRAGLVEERAAGWCLSERGERRFRGFAAIFDQLAEELANSTAGGTPKAKPDPPQPPEHLRLPRCICGCRQALPKELYEAKRCYLPGHEPAKKLSPRERLRREREINADAKPVISTCSRCGASFGPGPVSQVRRQFAAHECVAEEGRAA